MSFSSRLEDIISSGELVVEHRLAYEKSKYDRYAIERALMIIAEAMKVLSNKYGVDWERHSNMIKMGDILDHQYSAIDYSIVINMIDYDLPELIKLARKIKNTVHNES